MQPLDLRALVKLSSSCQYIQLMLNDDDDKRGIKIVIISKNYELINIAF